MLKIKNFFSKQDTAINNTTNKKITLPIVDQDIATDNTETIAIAMPTVDKDIARDNTETIAITTPTIDQNPVITPEIPCSEYKPVEKSRHVTFMLKNGYFYPQGKRLRSIVHGGYWVEGAALYDLHRGLNIEAAGSFFSKKGSDKKTKITIPTFGLGLKYFWRHDTTIRLFLGIGGRIFFYKEKNNSHYIVPSIKKTLVGGILNAGVSFNPYKGLLIDLFADYTFAKVPRKNRYCTGNEISNCTPSKTYQTNIGGLIAGVGVGYTF